MKQLLFYYFRELLLCAMTLVFAGLATYLLSHNAPEVGFRWASGASVTLIGALLMMMRGQNQPEPKIEQSNVGQGQEGKK